MISVKIMIMYFDRKERVVRFMWLGITKQVLFSIYRKLPLCTVVLVYYNLHNYIQNTGPSSAI